VAAVAAAMARSVEMGSSADLIVDTAQLDAVAARADTALADFTAAPSLSDGVERAAAHEDVSSALDHFRGAWSIRRGHLIQDLEDLRDAAQAIRDTFVATDRQLATQAELMGDSFAMEVS
jgi:hypothetical protein